MRLTRPPAAEQHVRAPGGLSDGAHLDRFYTNLPLRSVSARASAKENSRSKSSCKAPLTRGNRTRALSRTQISRGLPQVSGDTVWEFANTAPQNLPVQIQHPQSTIPIPPLPNPMVLTGALPFGAGQSLVLRTPLGPNIEFLRSSPCNPPAQTEPHPPRLGHSPASIG